MNPERERELFGPTEEHVLFQQSTHRSRLSSIRRPHQEQLLSVYQGSSAICWATRYQHANVEKIIVLHPRVWDRLEVIGLYGAARCGAMMLDTHLITALIERWRPETHTFHLPVGEATVTLQDVAIIWGLPIEGNPITVYESGRSMNDWRAYCAEWLGFTPNDWEMRGKSAIKLSALTSRLQKILMVSDYTTQQEVDQYTRICALILLGGLLMPDTNPCSVPLVYLQLLEDIQMAGQYSWGSAVLASLYREMCNASDALTSSIAGGLTLLQIWAWSRITTIQPRNIRSMILPGPYFGVNNRNLGVPPYASWWICHHNYTASTNNNICVYRDILDRLTNDQFIWQPYDIESPEIQTLGPRCITSRWMTECPLINIGIVEIHRPNRVLRQFGCIQDVPSDIEITNHSLHDVSRFSGKAYDWFNKHQLWIVYWRTRAPYGPVVEIRGEQTIVDGYMQWYNRITRRLISPDHYDGDGDNSGYQPVGPKWKNI